MKGNIQKVRGKECVRIMGNRWTRTKNDMCTSGAENDKRVCDEIEE